VPQEFPWWIGVLQLAQEWSTPAWEIAEDDDRLLWFLRYQIYKRVTAEAEKERQRLHG
jgi:hypothetical protein